MYVHVCGVVDVCQPPNSIELLMAIDANGDGVALWRLLLLTLLTTDADGDGGVVGRRPDVPARADDADDVDVDDDCTRPIQWQLYSLLNTYIIFV